MNKSQRIWLDSGNTKNDKYIHVRLEQDIDTIEIMSLKLNTKDAYQNFNADYGVLVGRVIANNGIGIENAKISIFIPLDENDKNNGDIVSIYPYEKPSDKNNDGKRYNLLPRVSKIDPRTNEVKPKQPFGSFPTKEEIITNPTYLEVYKKYYKYTTVTNSAGDYMIFGVPIGTQTVHMSVDITDIGTYSMTPAAMVNLGYPPNLFKNNNTRIKESDDLDILPNIETQEISVNVIPFWGDAENFDIGITRVDFRIRAQLVNTFIIFGSVYTDGNLSIWGGNDYRNGLEVVELYRILQPYDKNVGILSKRIGNVTEKVYAYPADVTDDEITQRNVNGGVDFDYSKKMIKLDPSEYSSYKRDGDFILIINCNRKKMITSETGEKINVSNDYPGGVFTEFKGFITLEYTEEDIPMNFDVYLNSDDRGRIIPIRHRIKIPQQANRGHSFRKEVDDEAIADTNNWRGQYYTFEAGNYYSISKFHASVSNTTEGDSYNPNDVNGFLDNDHINTMDENLFNTVGAIQTNDYGVSGNTFYEMPSNALTDNNNREVFVSNWMNFSVYLPQVPYLTSNNNRVRDMRSNTLTSQNYRYSDGNYYMKDNTQPFVAGDFNTKWFARSDIHWTTFINVPPKEIKDILNNVSTKGFKKTDINTFTLKGDYMNGQKLSPINGGRLNARSTNGPDPETYFFRGFGSSDSLQFLDELNLI